MSISVDEIPALYAKVPHVPCKGLCQRACGPVPCSAVEALRMRNEGIMPPTVREHPVHGPMTCSHLTDAGRCAVYGMRPLVCRLFGAVRAMKCPHGCRPDGGWLPEVHARKLVARMTGGQPMHLPITPAAQGSADAAPR